MYLLISGIVPLAQNYADTPGCISIAAIEALISDVGNATAGPSDSRGASDNAVATNHVNIDHKKRLSAYPCLYISVRWSWQ
jgi:hypothetical protein